MRKDSSRLQFEIDGHEIVIGYPAHQPRRPRSDYRRRPRDRMQVANREPIKFRPDRSWNQSGESESRTVRDVDAIDLEPMRSQMLNKGSYAWGARNRPGFTI